MEIKTKKHFNKLVKELTLEVFKSELEENTVTDDIAGYNTPFAFTGGKDKGKKKKRKVSTNSTGYNMVEGVNDKDMKTIKKTIRNVVANILRDIWLKRAVWKNPK